MNEDTATVAADRVAAAVTAVPGVSALHPGMFGEVATYLPGRRVSGIRLSDQSTDIHVSVAMGAPILATAAAVRRAVSALVSGPVNVTVEDIVPTSASNGAAR